jgi:hypothetical protein
METKRMPGETSPSHFVVSLQGVVWQINHRGTVTGPLATKAEALRALREAQRATDAGVPSEVIVENEHREFETAWRAEGAEPAPLPELKSDD